MHLLLFSVPHWWNVSLWWAFPSLALPSILLETCVKIKTWWGIPSTTQSTVKFDFAGDVHQSAVICCNLLTLVFCYFAGDVLQNIDFDLLGNTFWQITKTMFCLRHMLFFSRSGAWERGRPWAIAGLDASRAKFLNSTIPQKPSIFFILLFIKLLISELGDSGTRFLNFVTL